MERRKESEEHRDDASAMDTDGNDSSCGKVLFKKQSNQRSKEVWQKPSFNKSVSLRKQIECTNTESTESEASDKPMLKGSKVIMPEYVIGQKVSSSKTKKHKLSSSTNSTQTSDTKQSKQQNQKPLLQHLFDEDQDEDDSGEMDEN